MADYIKITSLAQATSKDLNNDTLFLISNKNASDIYDSYKLTFPSLIGNITSEVNTKFSEINQTLTQKLNTLSDDLYTKCKDDFNIENIQSKVNLIDINQTIQQYTEDYVDSQLINQTEQINEKINDLSDVYATKSNVDTVLNSVSIFNTLKEEDFNTLKSLITNPPEVATVAEKLNNIEQDIYGTQDSEEQKQLPSDLADYYDITQVKAGSLKLEPIYYLLKKLLSNISNVDTAPATTINKITLNNYTCSGETVTTIKQTITGAIDINSTKYIASSIVSVKCDNTNIQIYGLYITHSNINSADNTTTIQITVYNTGETVNNVTFELQVLYVKK